MEKLLSKYAITFAISTLVISCILVVFILYEFSLTKKRFATELTSQSVEQIKNEIDGFFGPITNLINSAKNQYEHEFKKGLSDDALNRKFVPLIEHFPQLSSMGIADDRGYEFDILPDSIHNKWLNRKVWMDQWGTTERWNYWNPDTPAAKDSAWSRELSMDPRERPWFKGALGEKGHIFWSLPYKYTTNQEYGITASILLHDAGNRSTILAFDLTISDIIRFVNDLKLTDHQKVFLLTGDNNLVIALNKSNFSRTDSRVDFYPLHSPSELGDSGLLKVLNAPDNHKAFKFVSKGKNWWGVLIPYQLSSSRTINIVSVLPEKDFALEINRTQASILGSFSLIILLTVIIVMNHNKLHRTSALLIEKNDLISEQKRVLSSEVHHRVKNNLAIISAFLELDLLDNPTDDEITPLAKNQQRIKVIALVQEEAYKSESLENASVSELVTSVMRNCQKISEQKPVINLDLEKATINVNQALSYALFLNEVVYELINRNKDITPNIDIKVQKDQSHLITTLRTTGIQEAPSYTNLLDHSIITALVNQLDAQAQCKSESTNELFLLIDFELQKKKGIVGNQYFTS